MQAEILIQSLIDQTRLIIRHAECMQTYDLQTLMQRPHAGAWNMLECLEHLNRYGDFYLPEMQLRIKSTQHKPDGDFKSGPLGGYFVKSILPGDKPNTMKTLKKNNPLHAELDKEVIARFIDQQTQLLDILDQARGVSLNKVKTRISIAPFIHLKLGDTLQFYVNHMIRHFKQIERLEAGVHLS